MYDRATATTPNSVAFYQKARRHITSPYTPPHPRSNLAQFVDPKNLESLLTGPRNERDGFRVQQAAAQKHVDLGLGAVT